MKKIGVLVFVLLLIALPLILQTAVQVTAQDENPMDAALPAGFKKIPQTEEEWEKAKQEYLSKEWDKIILDNKYIGPIYGFLKKALVWLSPVFIIIFAEPYSFSWAFFFVVVLWLIFYHTSLNALKLFIESKITYLIALALPVILAQIKFFRLISEFLIALFFDKQTWYIKWLIIGAIILGFIFLYILQQVLFKSFQEWIKKKKKEKKEKKSEQIQKEVEAREKGIEEGEKIKEKSGYKGMFDNFIGR